MKILFLDFDGVINTFMQFSNEGRFSATACRHITELLAAVPNLQIVVSSAWRHSGLNAMKKLLSRNGIDSDRVLDVTGTYKEGQGRGNRGYEIQQWLAAHPEVVNFVIIDDDSDMGELTNKMVKTNSFIGITTRDVHRAIEILHKDDRLH